MHADTYLVSVAPFFSSSFDSNSPSCSLSTLNRSTHSQEIKEGEFPLALLPFIFLPAAGMTPSPPPNVSSSSPSFFRSRLILARRSLCSDLAPFLAADLWEHRSRHGGSGARPHRRQHAAAGSRRCSRRLKANPAELLRHQLRLTILSKTPQESLRTVQRGGRSTTVFSNSDLAPPSSISIQPNEPSTVTHGCMHGVPSASDCSRRLRRSSHHWRGKS